MRTLVDHLSQYADYHRDRRNIATHGVGVPMIAFAVVALLSRPAFHVGGLALSPAVPLILLVLAFYFRLDVRYGIAMTAFFAAAGVVGALLAPQPTTIWLAASVGGFVVGWIIQFIGHGMEGRKPAFVDDLVGLIVGPLFVVAELGFALGMRSEVQAEVERRSGKTHGGKTRGGKREGKQAESALR